MTDYYNKYYFGKQTLPANEIIYTIDDKVSGMVFILPKLIALYAIYESFTQFGLNDSLIIGFILILVFREFFGFFSSYGFDILKISSALSLNLKTLGVLQLLSFFIDSVPNSLINMVSLLTLASFAFSIYVGMDYYSERKRKARINFDEAQNNEWALKENQENEERREIWGDSITWECQNCGDKKNTSGSKPFTLGCSFVGRHAVGKNVGIGTHDWIIIGGSK